MNLIIFVVSITEDPGDRVFKIYLDNGNGGHTRGSLYTYTIENRHDGSYVVIFRIREAYRGPVSISIQYNDQHVAESPYLLKGKHIIIS